MNCRATQCGGSRGFSCLVVLKGNKRCMYVDVQVATTTWSLHRTPLCHILQILLCPATCDWRDRNAAILSFQSFFFSFFVISFYVCVSVCLFCLASPAMNNSNPKWHRASWESFNLMKLSLPDITYWCAVLHLWASNCSNLTTQQLIHYDDFQSRMMESHIIGNQSFIDISCIFCINLAMTDIVLGWKLSHVVFRNLS